MQNYQRSSESLLGQGSRLAVIETELGRAYQSRDVAMIQQMRAAFDAPELKELRSGTALWGRVKRALDLNALPEAASIARDAVELLVAAASAPNEVGWWNPHQEAVTFGVKMLSAPQLLGEPDFSPAAVRLLRYVADLTQPEGATRPNSPEEFQNFACRAADAVRLFSGFHSLFSQPSQLGPMNRALLCGAVGIDLLTGAQEALATLERGYCNSIRKEDSSRPSSEFLPLARAALDLEQVQPGAISALCERLVSAAEAEPTFGKAALVALHYHHRHLQSSQSIDAAGQLQFQTLVERFFSLSLADQGRLAFAIIPLFQETERIQSALATLAQSSIKDSIAEFLELYQGEETGEYGDAVVEELDSDGEQEDPEFDRELSSVPLEDFPFYRVAPILRALSEGRFYVEDMSLGFGTDRELLSGIERRFPPCPAQAIAIGGALICLDSETLELSTAQLAELFQDAELCLALRPTREDVSEPTCFAGVLLAAIEELTRTRLPEDDELRAILVEAIEDGRIFVTKNIWQDLNTGEKAFDQGLPPTARDQFEDEDDDRQLQVAEERDYERTRTLLAALRPGGISLPHPLLTDEYSPTPRSSETRPVSMDTLRTAQELIDEVLTPGTFAGLSFEISGIGIGLLDGSSHEVGVVVHLSNGDEALRRDLESRLSKLVPTPVQVLQRGPITIR
jgi:hypothetical protein